MAIYLNWFYRDFIDILTQNIYSYKIWIQMINCFGKAYTLDTPQKKIKPN